MQIQPQRHRGTEALPAKVGLCVSVPLWLIIIGIILIANHLSLAQNDRAAERALTYLAKTQNADGSFGTAKDVDRQTVATSVSLLAFVSAGHAPDLGKFGSSVRAATDYLLQTSRTKMSVSARAACFTALGEVAGIDDSPQDQTQLSRLLGTGAGEAKIIPFTGSLAEAGRTLLVMRSENQSRIPTSLSYSALYRAAVFSSRFYADELTQRIDAWLISWQRADGAWDDDPELTAYAVLALTAGDHLMPLAP
jgi:Prenyltransferase and squalene oxidase repeat